ncbi:hypothetical protein VTO73DRAFT_6195 [Trametes versicolor]
MDRTRGSHDSLLCYWAAPSHAKSALAFVAGLLLGLFQAKFPGTPLLQPQTSVGLVLATLRGLLTYLLTYNALALHAYPDTLIFVNTSAHYGSAREHQSPRMRTDAAWASSTLRNFLVKDIGHAVGNVHAEGTSPVHLVTPIFGPEHVDTST